MAMPRRGRVKGPLASYAAGFFEELAGRSYRVRSAETHLLLMGRLSRWLEERSLDPGELTTEGLSEFLRWNHARSRFPKSPAGMEPLLNYLRRLGAVPMPPPPGLSPQEELVERFRCYLRAERGLTVGTTDNHLYAARLFLQRVEPDAGLAALGGEEVGRFVVTECEGRSIATAKNLVKGLRSFLSFLHVEGITTTSLSGAIPTVSGFTGGGLPRGVDAGSAKLLLVSCDRRTAKGRRDFAILMLLTRLGLRAGEVVALGLDDLDWSRGEMLVRGKASRLERLPLPADVGEAVAGYLRRGRPPTDERALFLRVLAPHGRITVTAISAVVHAACQRAGLKPIATHRLRHTVASELLRRGAGLPEIGQLLRHRSAAVTSTYAKVDTAALRLLARPWPGDAA